MNETETERLRIWLMQELKEDFDKFDFKAHIDTSLTYDENLSKLLDMIDSVRENEITADDVREAEIMRKMENYKLKEKRFPLVHCKNDIKVMVVYGNTGSGKTALVYKSLEYFDKPIYLFKHPKPDMIRAMGYNVMRSLSELNKLKGIVLWIDEPQLFFEKYEKRSNETFLRLCSMARQRDITLIFSTSDTRWINQGLESYVTHWVIKDIDPKLIKRGSVAKKIIKEMVLVPDEFFLDKSDFLFYCRDFDVTGHYSFKKPKYFTDELSKAFGDIGLQ